MRGSKVRQMVVFKRRAHKKYPGIMRTTSRGKRRVVNLNRGAHIQKQQRAKGGY